MSISLEINLATVGMVFLYFTAFFFWGLITYVNVRAYLKKKRDKKIVESAGDNFKNFIESLQKMAKEAGGEVRVLSKKVSAKPEGKKPEERQTFQWRHRGEMQSVDIVIMDGDDEIEGSLEEFKEALAEGRAGKLEELMGQVSPQNKEKIGVAKEFKFSRRAVQQLRLAGMTPDEMVIKVLKASGRMD